jgi:aldose 1-epimerase
MQALAVVATLSGLVVGQPTAPTDFNCSSQPAGTFDRITIKNSKGLEASFIRYGATLTNLIFPDDKGAPRDLVLGFEDTKGYCDFGGKTPNHPYFGATIGRVANRISKGTFELDGVTYHTPLNDHGYDTLHGGWVGYDRRVWTVASRSPASVTFSLFSADGEMGFPGDVWINVTHSITENDEWTLQYEAKAGSKTTILAMTNHAYFNLNANVDGATTVLEHELTMPTVGSFVEVDPVHLLPTGVVGSVDDAKFLDFRKGKAVGKDIDQGNVSPLGGYDNAFVFSGWDGKAMEDVVTVRSPKTGISMVMSTDQPSVQIYTGNFLNATDATQIPRKTSQGGPDQYYHWRGAITFEAQHYPDSIHFPHFPSTILGTGQVYTQSTSYRFSTA